MVRLRTNTYPPLVLHFFNNNINTDIICIQKFSIYFLMKKFSVSFFVAVAITTVVGQYESNDNILQNPDFKAINQLYLKDLEERFSNNGNKENFPNNLINPKSNDNIPSFLRDLNITKLEEFLYIVLDVKSTKNDIEKKLEKWVGEQSESIKKEFSIFKAKEELRKNEFEKLHEIISSRFFPDAKNIDNQIIALFNNKSITKIDETLKVREIIKNAPCNALRQLVYLYPFVKSEMYKCIRRKQPLKMNIIVAKIGKSSSPFGMTFKSMLKPISTGLVEQGENKENDLLNNEQNKFNKIGEEKPYNTRNDKRLRAPTPLPDLNNVNDEIDNSGDDIYVLNKDNDMKLYNKKQMPRYSTDENNIRENKIDMMPPPRGRFPIPDMDRDMFPPPRRHMPFGPESRKPGMDDDMMPPPRGRFPIPDMDRDMFPPPPRRHMPFGPEFRKPGMDDDMMPPPRGRFPIPDMDRDMFPPPPRRHMPFGPASRRPNMDDDIIPPPSGKFPFSDMSNDMLPPTSRRDTPFVPKFKNQNKKGFIYSNFNDDMFMSFKRRFPFVPDFDRPNRRRSQRSSFEPSIIPPPGGRTPFGPEFLKPRKRGFRKPNMDDDMLPPPPRMEMPFEFEFERPQRRGFRKPNMDDDMLPPPPRREMPFESEFEGPQRRGFRKPNMDDDMLPPPPRREMSFDFEFERPQRRGFRKPNMDDDMLPPPPRREMLFESEFEGPQRRVFKNPNMDDDMSFEFERPYKRGPKNPDMDDDMMPPPRGRTPFEETELGRPQKKKFMKRQFDENIMPSNERSMSFSNKRSQRSDMKSGMMPSFERGMSFSPEFEKPNRRDFNRGNSDSNRSPLSGRNMPFDNKFDRSSNSGYKRPDFDMMPSSERRSSSMPDFQNQNRRGFRGRNSDGGMMQSSGRNMPFSQEFEGQNRRGSNRPDFDADMMSSSGRNMPFSQQFDRASRGGFKRPNFGGDMQFNHGNENQSGDFFNKPFGTNKNERIASHKYNNEGEVSLSNNQKPSIDSEDRKKNNLENTSGKSPAPNKGDHETEPNDNHMKHSISDTMYEMGTDVNFKNNRKIPEGLKKREAPIDAGVVPDQLPIIREARPE
uniref:DUF148 domain-containing protein n=1 Tax=Strongyloides venezuelensis TaxID=75913 RepID=A0A0K0F4Z7_STRVS